MHNIHIVLSTRKEDLPFEKEHGLEKVQAPWLDGFLPETEDCLNGRGFSQAQPAMDAKAWAEMQTILSWIPRIPLDHPRLSIQHLYIEFCSGYSILSTLL